MKNLVDQINAQVAAFQANAAAQVEKNKKAALTFPLLRNRALNISQRDGDITSSLTMKEASLSSRDIMPK